MIRYYLFIFYLFFVFTVFAQPISVSEICASNSFIMTDNYGDFDDWVELYNNTENDIDLSQYYVSDDLENPQKFQIPESLVLPAKSYLLLWCDNEPEQGVDHLGFKLSASGEDFLISNSNSELIDAISFGQQKENVSFGKLGQFSDKFVYFDYPTPNKYNQDFIYEIDDFYIECDPSDFDYIYEHYSEDYYIPVTLTYKDSTWTDTQMRIRGDSSRTYPKKSLKINFGEKKFINGRDKINLNGEYLDYSYQRSIITSLVYRESGHPSFYAKPVRLFLNGEFFGFYANIENIDEDFLFNWQINADSNVYKAVLDGSCLSSHDDVYYHWEKKIDEEGNRGDLQSLIDNLDQISDDEYYTFCQQNFEYDAMINIIACNTLLASGSTYYHNYYMFNIEPNSQKWMMLPWDMDRSMTHYGLHFSYQRSTRSNEFDNPFMERALLCSPIKNDLMNRIRDLNSTIFNADYLYPKMDHLQNLFEPEILLDYTDQIELVSEYTDAIEADKLFIYQRINYLENQFKNEPYTFKIIGSQYNETENNITLIWEEAKDPQNRDLVYTIKHSSSTTFLQENTIIYTTTDTTLTLPFSNELLDQAWTVSVSNGLYSIDGFNKINLFEDMSFDQDVHILGKVKNYPNPFIQFNNIQFILSEPTNVTLEIFNVRGQKIFELEHTKHNVGINIISWDGKNKDHEIVSNGVYLFQLKAKDVTYTGKMIKLK
jgi:spore coat protein CotH